MLKVFNLQVLEEIGEMESNVANLEQAIAEKEAPLKVAQTRLDNRTQRPNVELCRDRVQYRLVGEVGEITYNIGRLKDMLAEAEDSLKALRRTQLTLEDDIDVKVKSLFIDKEQNMMLRQQINHKLY